MDLVTRACVCVHVSLWTTSRDRFWWVKLEGPCSQRLTTRDWSSRFIVPTQRVICYIMEPNYYMNQHNEFNTKFTYHPSSQQWHLMPSMLSLDSKIKLDIPLDTTLQVAWGLHILHWRLCALGYAIWSCERIANHKPRKILRLVHILL